MLSHYNSDFSARQFVDNYVATHELVEISLQDTSFSFFLSLTYFLSFSFADRNQMLVDYAYLVQRFAFQESTKRNMCSQLPVHLIFCAHYQFSPLPESKNVFFPYLVFLSHSLAAYQSLFNYTNILKHINYALGANVSFMSDYGCSLT